MKEMSWKELVAILGSDNVDLIKRKLTETILDNLVDSIEHRWIITPSVIEEMFEELGNEVIQDLRKKYKRQLKKAMDIQFKRQLDALTNDEQDILDIGDRPECCVENGVYGATCDVCEYWDGEIYE